MKQRIEIKADYLFEISWEICNKVGGIYTVLSSKAAQVVGFYQDNYCLIGPYFSEKAKGEFQEAVAPAVFRDSFGELEREGIKCHYGKWLIEGEPNVILVDFINFWPQADQIKTQLWESFQIDSLVAGQDFAEPVIWSWVVGRVVEQLLKNLANKRVVAQFHEWLAGAGLLYLKKNNIRVATIFTTHATRLGRSLANSDIPLYSFLPQIDADQAAYQHKVNAKHQLEKAATKNCDVFTTVSEITGMETKYFLGREPDVLLPNGLDLGKFPTFEEVAIKHRIQRNRIREFIIYYFFPYYAFDLKETLFYFILGRYEFHNKGIDLFIKALADLNRKLRGEQSKKTVVAFFWIPAQIRGIKSEIIEARESYRDIKESLEELSDEIEENILSLLVAGERITQPKLFSSEEGFLREMKKKIMKLKRSGTPPLCTHDLINPGDVILESFKKEGLGNRGEDRVKVIFYPIYLTGSDGLLNLGYYEAIQGAHLGAFMSFYEPWGYTPLETAALGVASVTNDLTGFGRFLSQEVQDKEQPGIFILERFNKKDEEVSKDFSDVLYRFTHFSRQIRIDNKIQARKLAGLCDWQILIQNYIEAHNRAVALIYEG